MPVLIQSIILGFLSIQITRRCTGKYLTPCTLYWFGWVIGSLGYEFNTFIELMPALSDYGINNILLANYGAFGGFVFSSFFVRFERKTFYINNDNKYSSYATLYINKLFWALVIVNFFIGCYFLVNRIGQIGFAAIFNFSTIRDAWVEELYLKTQVSLLQKIFFHISPVISIIPIVLGMKDGLQSKISRKPLLLMWISGMPAGFSTGGRGWILSFWPAYLISYMLVSNYKFDYFKTKVQFALNNKTQKLILLSILALFIIFAFSKIGLNRNKDLYESSNLSASYVFAVLPVSMYLGVPMAASEPHSIFAESISNRYGLLTFDFFGRVFEKLGFVSGMTFVDFLEKSRDYVFMYQERSLATTHATFIPNVIGDFGLDNLLLATFVIVFFIQLIFFKSGSESVFGQTLAVHCCLYGGLYMFQGSLFANSGPVLTVLYAALFTRFAPASFFYRHN